MSGQETSPRNDATFDVVVSPLHSAARPLEFEDDLTIIETVTTPATARTNTETECLVKCDPAPSPEMGRPGSRVSESNSYADKDRAHPAVRPSVKVQEDSNSKLRNSDGGHPGLFKSPRSEGGLQPAQSVTVAKYDPSPLRTLKRK